MVTKYWAAWADVRLSDLATIVRGASPRPIESFLTDSPTGTNWIKIGDAPKKGRFISRTAERVTKEGAEKSVHVVPGDLILSNSMSFGRPYILRISGCIHDGWLRLSDFDQRADASFLAEVLGSNFVLQQYKSLAAGSGVQNLNKEAVGKVVIPLPSLPEQRAIADVLAGFDEHLANLDALIAKKKAVRDGALEELIFPVQLPRSQDTRDQAEVRLGELVYELSDAIHPGSRPSENFVEYSMPSYDQGQHATTVAGSSMLSARREIHTPCVLVNKLNVRKQRIWMIQEPEPNAVCSLEFVPLASNELDLAYLKYLALSRKFTEYLEANTTGTSNSQKRVTASTILAFKFNVPSTQKQREIGATLSSMDAEIAALVEERAKVERLKQGATEDLLTGRVRLLVHEEAS